MPRRGSGGLTSSLLRPDPGSPFFAAPNQTGKIEAGGTNGPGRRTRVWFSGVPPTLSPNQRGSPPPDVRTWEFFWVVAGARPPKDQVGEKFPECSQQVRFPRENPSAARRPLQKTPAGTVGPCPRFPTGPVVLPLFFGGEVPQNAANPAKLSQVPPQPGPNSRPGLFGQKRIAPANQKW